MNSILQKDMSVSQSTVRSDYFPDLERAKRKTVMRMQVAPIASTAPKLAPKRMTESTTADNGSKHVSMEAIGGAINSMLLRKQQKETMVPQSTICK